MMQKQHAVVVVICYSFCMNVWEYGIAISEEIMMLIV